ncbi:hypothetical protein M409DRAFT_22238 [Zasmidium cellare ATCC 36951]|uniref:FAD/NAD(P)-binding domain-containing protein n=1 Tax=Zasmidium cellare ATCC 36951 TaxID=1080233 RepID=A0A6A6CNV8_ZASCE|nr:uncharacterized protein M409DRAFT_22238 [Zasmidium cellare ATCC 36951]KAF2167429.1 hypothetical protein M409DRAFT_22238 [Zasmidium cellare ATCC 36951]
MDTTDYDVVIVGAGISGICFAYRLQERNPHLRYCVLESRDDIGGTWSFFKYPGLRSDSDLHTFGFPWAPWTEEAPIAQGPAIVSYMRKTIAEAGIDKSIKLNHRVQGLAWSPKKRQWSVNTNVEGHVGEISAKFVLLGTGYYDYDEALHAAIPNIQDFRGHVVHPQFWPEHLDYSSKDIVVIGSGATAITLLPSLTKTAKHVTMLQRSPSYIMSVPVKDQLESTIRRYLPRNLAATLIRLKWIFAPTLFRAYCLAFPTQARGYMHKLTQAEIGQDCSLDPNFTPTYNPFDQRMCLSPDGDFYGALRSGKASIKTGTIATITDNSIILNSGETLHPDIIITATGLKLRLGGGIPITIDSEPFHIPNAFVWKGLMLEGCPNLAFSFGYFDASWTLGVDMSAQLVCKIVKQMERDGVDVIVPERSDAERKGMEERSFLQLSSTYVEKGRAALPKVGNMGPWKARRTFLWEWVALRFGDVRKELRWVRSGR